MSAHAQGSHTGEICKLTNGDTDNAVGNAKVMLLCPPNMSKLFITSQTQII